MLKKLLWLDDFRVPDDDWVMMFSPLGINVDVHWVMNYNEFVAWIKNRGLPDAICFDHDLGLNDKGDAVGKTGHDCAKWLVDYCLDNDLELPLYSSQSGNPTGRENIIGLLKSFKKHQEKKQS